MAIGKPNPGSAKKGKIDLRSSNANGNQADEVEPHSDRAARKPSKDQSERDETRGALKDQTER